jgi:predicted negative regulator of RcsB-dependent stress response
MGRRITRKQLKQDEFVSFGEAVFNKISEFWRPLLAGLGAVVVLILLWGAISWWGGSRSEGAAEQLYQAVAAYKGDDESGAVSGDPAAAESAFQEVVDRYGSSDQADVARLYLAQIARSRGEGDRARDLLREVSEGSGDHAVKRLAAVELIHLRVDAGQGAEVVQELEGMVAAQDPRLPRDVAIYELAMTLHQGDENDRAREYLQRLVDEFPESPYRESAMQKLRELG